MDKPNWTNWTDKKSADLNHALSDITARNQAAVAAFSASVSRVTEDTGKEILFSFSPEDYKP